MTDPMDWQQVHERVKAMSNLEREDFARRHHLRLSKLEDIASSPSNLSETSFRKIHAALMRDLGTTNGQQD